MLATYKEKKKRIAKEQPLPSPAAPLRAVTPAQMQDLLALRKNYSASRKQAAMGDKAALLRLLKIGREIIAKGGKIPKRRKRP